jgi:hypothetical protein
MRIKRPAAFPRRQAHVPEKWKPVSDKDMRQIEKGASRLFNRDAQGADRCRCGVLAAPTCQSVADQPGSSTVSITWITPFD